MTTNKQAEVTQALTDTQIHVLNMARRVLWGVTRGYPKTPDEARIKAFAEVAENSIFDALNVANVFGGLELTKNQLHYDARPAQESADDDGGEH